MVENIDNEIWKPVMGYEGIYECSNMGRIKSLNTSVSVGGGGHRVRMGRIKSCHKNSNGYLRVQFSKNGVNKSFFVHRVVLSSFVKNIFNKPQVNHKNGVTNDNRLENLEWCTARENTNHAFCFLGRKIHLNSKRGEENHLYGKGDLKPQCKNIHCDTLDITFPSIRSAGRLLGIENSRIGLAARGKIVHASGLTFRYI